MSASRKLCMGNQMLAFGALKAGVNVASGYPGTPSTEVLETLSAQAVACGLRDLHIEWSANEKAALEVGAGAAFAGARALVTMKQVGLNVASDALMSLPYLGVKGGLVLVVADDPGPISSQTEQDTRQYAAFAKVPVFDPSTPEEAFAMMTSAFELSERYKTPVIVRPTTRVCHGTAVFEEDVAYTPHTITGFERGSHWVVFPRRAFEGHQEILDRLSHVAADFSTSSFNTVENTHASAPAHLGIAAGGISFAYLHDALVSLDTNTRQATLGSCNGSQAPGKPQPYDRIGPLRLFKVGTPYPFPEARALSFLEGLSEVLVFEELEPVIERQLLQLAGAFHLPVKVMGKLTGHTVTAGENSVDTIAQQLAAFCGFAASVDPVDLTPSSSGPKTKGDGSSVLAAQFFAQPRQMNRPLLSSPPTPPTLPQRPPVLCAGCPHRASFYAVKRALRGRKAVFSGDIGCYTLGNALPLDMVDTCVCMGAGLTIPQGMNWAQPDVPHLGFVGDSTFFASGLTGVVNAVYNHAKITLCVLDNATTAMTGSQPHPGTGIRLSPGTAHDQQKDAECAPRIPNILRALGVKHVEEIDPFKLEGAIKAIREAVAFEGPSALVFRAPCVTVAAPKPHLKVIAKNCTTCLSCIRAIGCPALTTREQQVAIDTTLCYGCGLCASVCPFDAIAVTPKGQANAEEASTAIIPEVGHSKTVTPDTTKETPGDDAMGAGGNRDD